MLGAVIIIPVLLVISLTFDKLKFSISTFCVAGYKDHVVGGDGGTGAGG